MIHRAVRGDAVLGEWDRSKTMSVAELRVHGRSGPPLLLTVELGVDGKDQAGWAWNVQNRWTCGDGEIRGCSWGEGFELTRAAAEAALEASLAERYETSDPSP